MDFSFETLADGTVIVLTDALLRCNKRLRLSMCFDGSDVVVSDCAAFLLLSASSIEDGEAFLETEAAKQLLQIHGVSLAGFELQAKAARANAEEAMMALATAVLLLDRHFALPAKKPVVFGF